MKGMLLKDLISQRKRIIAIVVVTVGIMCFMGLIVLSICYGNIRNLFEDGEFSPETIRKALQGLNFAFACMISMVTSPVAAFYDDRINDFEKIELSLPVSDFHRVASRYLYYLMFFCVELAIFLCACPLIYGIAKLRFGMKDMCIGLSAFSISLIVILIEMPVIYALGNKITQIINICVFMVLCIVFYATFSFISEHGVSPEKIEELLKKIAGGLSIFFPIGMTLGLLVSCKASEIICKRRRG